MSGQTDREWLAEVLWGHLTSAGFEGLDPSETHEIADALLASDGWRTHVTEPLLVVQGRLLGTRLRAERAEAESADLRARVEVHGRYFDLDKRPGEADSCPEPEEVWRYDRDLRAALDATPAPDALDRMRAEAGGPSGFDDRADRAERGDA